MLVLLPNRHVWMQLECYKKLSRWNEIQSFSSKMIETTQTQNICHTSVRFFSLFRFLLHFTIPFVSRPLTRILSFFSQFIILFLNVTSLSRWCPCAVCRVNCAQSHRLKTIWFFLLICCALRLEFWWKTVTIYSSFNSLLPSDYNVYKWRRSKKREQVVSDVTTGLICKVFITSNQCYTPFHNIYAVVVKFKFHWCFKTIECKMKFPLLLLQQKVHTKNRPSAMWQRGKAWENSVWRFSDRREGRIYIVSAVVPLFFGLYVCVRRIHCSFIVQFEDVIWYSWR